MADTPSRDPMQSVLSPTVVVRRKKKSGHDGGHHGGAWKIAYADFVTAMMAFFLLMWLLGSTSKYDKQGIEDYFNAPLSTIFGGKDGSGAARTSVIDGGGRDLSSSRPGEGDQAPDPAVAEDDRARGRGSGREGRRAAPEATQAEAQRVDRTHAGACARTRIRFVSTSRARDCASRSWIRSSVPCSRQAVRSSKLMW